MPTTTATDWASARGLPHVLSKNGEISMECPKCKTGKLIVQGSKGWFFCVGNTRCWVSGETFKDLDKIFTENKIK